MNPIDLLRRRRKARHTSAADAYWPLAREASDGQHKGEAEAAAVADALDAAATQLGLDVDVVALHVAQLTELLQLGDPQAQLAALQKQQAAIHAELQAEQARWTAACVDHDRRAKALDSRLAAVMHAFQENSTRTDRVAELRRALEEAGAPPATMRTRP